MRTAWIALVVAAASSMSCSQTPEAPKHKPAPKDPQAMSGWHQLSLPVPSGKTIPCAKMLPDANAFQAEIQTALGKDKKITIDDDAKSDGNATTVCSVKLAGKPLTKAEQQAKLASSNGYLGVQPGDEICAVHAICWYALDATSMKHDCDDKHFEGSTDMGDYTCIQHMAASDHQRAIVSVLDPDTKCKMEVHAGPSEFDDNLVKACAKAAIDLIGPAQIAP